MLPRARYGRGMNRCFSLPLLGGAAVALVALPFAVAIAQSPRAPYAIAETGQTHRSLQDAVDAIGAGTGTIAIAPGHYADCAVQTAGDVQQLANKEGLTAHRRSVEIRTQDHA